MTLKQSNDMTQVSITECELINTPHPYTGTWMTIKIKRKIMSEIRKSAKKIHTWSLFKYWIWKYFYVDKWTKDINLMWLYYHSPVSESCVFVGWTSSTSWRMRYCASDQMLNMAILTFNWLCWWLSADFTDLFWLSTNFILTLYPLYWRFSNFLFTLLTLLTLTLLTTLWPRILILILMIFTRCSSQWQPPSLSLVSAFVCLVSACVLGRVL